MLLDGLAGCCCCARSVYRCFFFNRYFFLFCRCLLARSLIRPVFFPGRCLELGTITKLSTLDDWHVILLGDQCFNNYY